MAAPLSYKTKILNHFITTNQSGLHFSATSLPSCPSPPCHVSVSFALFLTEILTNISRVFQPELIRSFYSQTLKGSGASRLIVISRLTVNHVYLQD